jgi:hypothetical protein
MTKSDKTRRLSFILSAVSIFFIIVRGIEFSDLKSEKWLRSLFFSSILLIQPIEVTRFEHEIVYFKYVIIRNISCLFYLKAR